MFFVFRISSLPIYYEVINFFHCIVDHHFDEVPVKINQAVTVEPLGILFIREETPEPHAIINSTTVTLKFYEDIDFNGNASGGIKPYNYSWDFGDENSDCDYWLYKKCDECGEDYEEVE